MALLQQEDSLLTKGRLYLVTNAGEAFIKRLIQLEEMKLKKIKINCKNNRMVQVGGSSNPSLALSTLPSAIPHL